VRAAKEHDQWCRQVDGIDLAKSRSARTASRLLAKTLREVLVVACQ
jgi:hypothetical protein